MCLKNNVCGAATMLAAALMFSMTTGVARAGTPGVDEPPAAGAARPLQVPPCEEDRLPNGVRVIVAPLHALPLASVALYLRGGAAADPPGKAGLSALVTELRTKGAIHDGQALSATELAQAAEALGSTLQASGGLSGSTTSMTVAASKLEAATALVAAVVRRPALAEDELERLRTQVADGLKVKLADPMALAHMVARRGAWGASAYGNSPTPDSLARITLADVRDWQRGQAQPDAATLVFSGDVSLAQARRLAARALGDWHADAQAAAPQADSRAAAPLTPATVLVNLPGAGQSAVVVMAPSVAIGSPERRVAQLAGALLGSGFNSRLNAEVRIKRGLSYGADAHNDMQPPGGWLVAAAQTDHRTAAEVAQVMQREIARLGQADGAPAADELAARQAALVGGFGRRVETTSGLAGAVLDLVANNRPLAELARLAPEIQAVTTAQVQNFAAAHWPAAAMRTVVVGDLTAAGASLKALDGAARQLQAAQLDLQSPRLSAADIR